MLILAFAVQLLLLMALLTTENYPVLFLAALLWFTGAGLVHPQLYWWSETRQNMTLWGGVVIFKFCLIR